MGERFGGNASAIRDKKYSAVGGFEFAVRHGVWDL
jgi:hypothetical protein